MLQDYFGDKKEDCQVLGKPNEPIVFKSVGRGKSPHDENNKNTILLQDGTKITTGDIITRPDNSIHLVVSRRRNIMADKGQTLKANTTVSLYSITGNSTTGLHMSTIVENIPAHQKTVNAAMKLFDSGLLEKTVYTFIIPKYNLKLGDRINEFQVNSIDTTSYEGFMYVQVETDKRVIR